jgi:23S rRNA pseudouridine2605 synthase
VTTRSDPQGRPTVFERLPVPDAGRWITVGRLDVNTSGLLLLTTDGELAHRLMHPSSEVEREYRVRLRGRPGPAVLRQLLKGVTLDDGPARFDQVFAEPQASGQPEPDASHSIFRVVLHEGRNREVRRLWSAVGFEVSRLLRVRYGPIELPPGMRPGTVRRADEALIGRLDRAVGAKAATASAPESTAAPLRSAVRPARAPRPARRVLGRSGPKA